MWQFHVQRGGGLFVELDPAGEDWFALDLHGRPSAVRT
jgi:hypothetical protein